MRQTLAVATSTFVLLYMWCDVFIIATSAFVVLYVWRDAFITWLWRMRVHVCDTAYSKHACYCDEHVRLVWYATWRSSDLFVTHLRMWYDSFMTHVYVTRLSRSTLVMETSTLVLPDVRRDALVTCSWQICVCDMAQSWRIYTCDMTHSTHARVPHFSCISMRKRYITNMIWVVSIGVAYHKGDVSHISTQTRATSSFDARSRDTFVMWLLRVLMQLIWYDSVCILMQRAHICITCDTNAQES